MASWVELNTKSQSTSGGMSGDYNFGSGKGLDENKILIGAALVAMVFIAFKLLKKRR